MRVKPFRKIGIWMMTGGGAMNPYMACPVFLEMAGPPIEAEGVVVSSPGGLRGLLSPLRNRRRESKAYLLGIGWVLPIR